MSKREIRATIGSMKNSPTQHIRILHDHGYNFFRSLKFLEPFPFSRSNNETRFLLPETSYQKVAP